MFLLEILEKYIDNCLQIHRCACIKSRKGKHIGLKTINTCLIVKCMLIL